MPTDIALGDAAHLFSINSNYYMALKNPAF